MERMIRLFITVLLAVLTIVLLLVVIVGLAVLIYYFPEFVDVIFR